MAKDNVTTEPTPEAIRQQPQVTPPYLPPYPPYPYYQSEDEINLLDYLRVIWRGKWIITLLFFISVTTTGWYSFNMPKIYQAKTTIIPTDAGGGGLASALSSLPFASGLAGSLPSTPMDKIMAILDSRTITQKVILRLDLMPVLFDGEWDPIKKAWKESPDPPTMEKAITALQEGIVKVSSDKRGTVSIVVEFTDPKLSASIANNYIQILAEYLNDHAINTNFQVLDPAVIPEKKFKPRIRFNVMTAGAVSLFLGIFLLFVVEYVREVWKNEKFLKISPKRT